MSTRPKRLIHKNISMNIRRLSSANANHEGKRLGAIVRLLRSSCMLLALALVFCAIAAPLAFADVRSSDVIDGRTVEERGIDPSRCPSIDASYAMLVTDKGNIVFERDAYADTQIASITKVMTAIVALEYAPLDANVIVSDFAAEVGESSAGLAAGDKMALQDALCALMLPSGNDAAIAIAESIGVYVINEGLNADDGARSYFSNLGIDASLLDTYNDPASSPVSLEGADDSQRELFRQVFVCAMNVQAAKIGMQQSVFTNPHGLDNGRWEGQMKSCAADVATMCSYAMGNETFRQIVALPEATITVTTGNGEKTDIELESTDLLIGSYEGACGIKTGYTEKAGNSFAGACEREGDYIYAIVLDSTSEVQRFEDAKSLYNWYYDNFVVYRLINSPDTVTVNWAGQTRQMPVVAEITHRGWMDETVTASVADPDETVEVFAFNGNVSQKVTFSEITGDVHVGDTVGLIEFYQNNSVIAQMDLIAAEEVAAPNFIEGVVIWWQRLFNDFNDEPDAATSYTLNETPRIIDNAKLAA